MTSLHNLTCDAVWNHNHGCLFGQRRTGHTNEPEFSQGLLFLVGFSCLPFLILPLAKFSNIIDLTALTLLDENWVWAEWWHHRFTQSCFI